MLCGMKEYYYHVFIESQGNQEQFWETIGSESPSDIDHMKDVIEETIQKRIDYLDSVVNPVQYSTAYLIGEHPGTVGCNILKRIQPLSGVVGEGIYFLEWVGNLTHFNEDCILVDGYSTFEQGWLRELAKKYKKNLITVQSVSKLTSKPKKDKIGAEYAIVIYDSKSGYESLLFGLEEDCWGWAAQLSSLAFTFTSNKNNTFFIEYANKYIGKERSLAVIGNSGCESNKLIKQGWQLTDCKSDIARALESKKDGERDGKLV